MVVHNRLYKVHEEDGKPFELEMSWICEESGWKHARVRPVVCCVPICVLCVLLAIRLTRQMSKWGGFDKVRATLTLGDSKGYAMTCAPAS